MILRACIHTYPPTSIRTLMATSKCTFETIIDTYIDTHIHTHIDRDDHLVAFKDVDLLGPPPDILVVVLAVFAQFGVEVGVGKPVLPDPLFALRLELRAQLRQCERTRARTHTHTHIYTHTHTHTHAYTHTFCEPPPVRSRHHSSHHVITSLLSHSPSRMHSIFLQVISRS
jgi:hypothetical protein